MKNDSKSGPSSIIAAVFITAVFTVGGALGGQWMARETARQSQQAAWENEQKAQALADRKAAYMAFIGPAGNLETAYNSLYAAKKVGTPTTAEIARRQIDTEVAALFGAMPQLPLYGSPAFVDAAHEVVGALSPLAKAAADSLGWEKAFDSYEKALAKLQEVARADLGITPPGE